MVKHRHPSGRPINPRVVKKRVINPDPPYRPDVVYATPRLRPEFDRKNAPGFVDAVSQHRIYPSEEDGLAYDRRIGFVTFPEKS